MNPHEPAGAYALDALDRGERAAFEQHLADCTTCRAEVAEYRDLLADIVPTSELPAPAVRTGILAAVAQTPQEHTSATNDSSPVADSSTPRTDAGGSVVPLRPHRRTARWATAVAAASAVIALATGAWAVVASMEASRASQQLTAQTGILTHPDARSQAFIVDDRSAVLIYSREADQALLVVDDLPTLPSQRVYQLWTVHEVGGEPEVRPNRTFDAGHQLQVPFASLSDAAQVAITIEPSGGSTSPTMPIIGATELA